MVVTPILSLGASEQEGSITSGSKMYGMGTVYQGAGKRPRQCCPKGPKTK